MNNISVSMSDAAIARELYARAEANRKRLGLSQTDVADKLGITPKSYRAIKNGTCKLTTFIALLRVLELLDNFNELIPTPKPSPIEIARTMDRLRKTWSAFSRIELDKQNLSQSDGKKEPYKPLGVFLNRQKLIVKE